MAFIADKIFDDGLNTFNSDCDMLTLCSTEPTTYTEARTTYEIGNKTNPTISTAADRAGGGREVTVSAITTGTIVNNDGSALYYALLDTTTSTLLAVGNLDDPINLTTSDTFTLTEFTIGIPDIS